MEIQYDRYEEYIKGSFDSKLNQLTGFKDTFNEFLFKITSQADEVFLKVCFRLHGIEHSSFLNAVGSKSMVVVKLRDTSQPNSVTKRDVMKNIDLVELNLKVSQVKQIKDGSLSISFEDSEGANNIKKIVCEKLSSEYRELLHRSFSLRRSRNSWT